MTADSPHSKGGQLGRTYLRDERVRAGPALQVPAVAYLGTPAPYFPERQQDA